MESELRRKTRGKTKDMDAQFAPVNAFCSFAEDDVSLLKQFMQHLKPLQDAGYLSVWSRNIIMVGSKTQKEVDEHLNKASLIMLLISHHFFASGSCISEMKRALQRDAAGEAIVIPILLSHCDWKETPIAAFQIFPTTKKPVTAWKDSNEAWTDVIINIGSLLHDKFGMKGNYTREQSYMDRPALLNIALTGQGQRHISGHTPDRIFRGAGISLLVIALCLSALLVWRNVSAGSGLTTALASGPVYSTPTTALASGPVYTVVHTHDTNPDGVYFRLTPHTQDFDAVKGFGVFWNDSIRVSCWSWGDAAIQNGNKVWYYAYNVNRPTVEGDGRSNQGWINSYYVNDGMTANHPAPGIPQCSSSLSDHYELATTSS